MPKYKSDDDLHDPDSVPRPVMAVGADIENNPGVFEMGAHHHRKAQLIYTARGVLTCEVSRGLWIVPPGCALWIPGGAQHDVKADPT